MLAMFNGFHSSEFFGRNDSVYLIAGIRLDVLVQVSSCYFFSAGLKNVLNNRALETCKKKK